MCAHEKASESTIYAPIIILPGQGGGGRRAPPCMPATPRPSRPQGGQNIDRCIIKLLRYILKIRSTPYKISIIQHLKPSTLTFANWIKNSDDIVIMVYGLFRIHRIIDSSV